MDNGDFYILSGGECQGGKGVLYLNKGSSLTKTIAYTVLVKADLCDFGQFNKNWDLSTFENGTERYHLLTYAPSQKSPKFYLNSLILETANSYQETAHVFI